MTQTILNQNETYTLALEKVSGQWWLELIERATGHVQIMYFGNKVKAVAMFDRMSMADTKRIYDKLNVKSSPMYKAGVK